jgi:methyltransferase
MIPILVLTFVTIERAMELWWATRNTRDLLARGGMEAAPAHYPLLVAVHGFWLGGLWLLAWNRPPDWVGLVAFAILQVLRFWVLTTLGRRWTTRIIIVPGETLVRAGPYRFMAHPNYAVVAGEIALLPLAFGLPWYALLFSLLNALVLTIRIKAENAALSENAAYPGRRPESSLANS